MKQEAILAIKSLIARDWDPNETMKWLTADRMMYWSWGVAKVVNFENKALVLQVSGMKHTGFVVITLNWNDTFQVNIMDKKGVILDTFKEVYVDVLAVTIDERIETT